MAKGSWGVGANPPSSSLCKVCFVDDRDIKQLGKKVSWYVKIWEMLNLCTEALKFYSRQEQRPGNLLNLNNINLQFAKWCCNNYIFTFYVSINCFHDICRNSPIRAKLKIFVQHKPKGFWRILHDVIMFGHDDIVNKMVPNFLVLFTYEIWWPLSLFYKDLTRKIQFFKSCFSSASNL